MDDMVEHSEQQELPPITNPCLVLLEGPSGTGKSAIIERAVELDPRLTPPTIFTDRPPRDNDYAKVSVSPVEFSAMVQRGELLTNEPAHGYNYGPLKSSVLEALDSGRIPIQDYPEDKAHKIKDVVPSWCIYIVPPSLGTLHQRLRVAGREERFPAGREELVVLLKKKFKTENIDDVVINRDIDQAAREVLKSIYSHCCK